MRTIAMMDFVDALFSATRHMDHEASTFRAGQPTGLHDYGAYFRPELRKPQTEPAWTNRLAELLPDYGFPTRKQEPYPSAKRERCDVVTTVGGRERLWVEIKGAWRDYWAERRSLKIYLAYLFYPMLPNLPKKTHSAVLDLKRLESLTRHDADAAAFFLVGFDATSDPMDQDIEHLEELTGLGSRPWVPSKVEWHDRYRPGKRVRLWYWQRQM